MRGKPLPRLLFFTDPTRVADPVAVARRLPAGAGVVYRAFGAADALETARALRAVADARGLTLLVGADPALADACAADGLHLPERMIAEAAVTRAKSPQRLITAAAHSADAIGRSEAAAADAVVVSPVFESASPSAGAALGAETFRRLAGTTVLPAFALGGVTRENAALLTGAAGFAAVDGVTADYGA